MEELDLLKKDWNKTNANFKEVSERELYKMLHKNSSSIVKWILIISICEILLWTALNLFNNIDELLASMNHTELKIYFDAVSVFNYVVSIGFIIQFYRNYKKISTVASTATLMKTILTTRKTVRYYVKYNLFMIVFGFIVGILLAFNYSPEMIGMRDKIMSQPSTMAGIIVAILISTCVFVGVFWVFYRLLYGILTKRLYNNYKELKAIDF